MARSGRAILSGRRRSQYDQTGIPEEVEPKPAEGEEVAGVRTGKTVTLGAQADETPAPPEAPAE